MRYASRYTERGRTSNVRVLTPHFSILTRQIRMLHRLPRLASFHPNYQLEYPKGRPPMATETETLAGSRLIERVREIIHEGNVRRIIVKNDEGQTIVELPVTVGVIGALLAPAAAALGAIAALLTSCTIEVVREEVEAPVEQAV